MTGSRLAVAAALSWTLASPALAQERCNPPHVECGEGNRTYRCPPCPSTRIQRFAEYGFARISASEVEQYQSALDSYRQALERDRLTLSPDAYQDALRRLEQSEALSRSASRMQQAQGR